MTALLTVPYVVVVLGATAAATDLFDFSVRIGFMWIFFLALSYVSEYMRKSERRLMKLFNTLNLRTSELEKSQAQLEMIYENTRVLAAHSGAGRRRARGHADHGDDAGVPTYVMILKKWRPFLLPGAMHQRAAPLSV